MSGLLLAADSPPGWSGSPEDGVAYDEDLACRVRAVLPLAEAVTERQMFGGLVFVEPGGLHGAALREWVAAAAAFARALPPKPATPRARNRR
jgi:hypothetical protein